MGNALDFAFSEQPNDPTARPNTPGGGLSTPAQPTPAPAMPMPGSPPVAPPQQAGNALDFAMQPNAPAPPPVGNALDFAFQPTPAPLGTPYQRQVSHTNANAGMFDTDFYGESPGIYADNRFEQQYGAAAIQSQRPQIAKYVKDKYNQDVDWRTRITPTTAAEYVKSTLPPDQVEKINAQYEKEYPIVKMIKDRDRYATAIMQAWKQRNPNASGPGAEKDMYEFIHRQLYGIGIDNEKMPPFTVTPDGIKTDVGRIHGFVDAFLRGSANLAYKPAEAIESLGQTIGDQVNGGSGAGASVNPGVLENMKGATKETQARYDALLPQSTAAQQGGTAARITEGAVEAAPMIIAAGATGQAGAVGTGLFGLKAGEGAATLAHAINFATMAASETAGSYDEIYQSAIKAGMTKEQASLSAGIGGSVAGAINAYIMKFGTVGNMEKNVAKDYLSHVAQNVAKQGGVSGAQDFYRQLANAVASGEPIDPARLVKSTVEGGVTGGLIAAVAPGKAPSKPGTPPAAKEAAPVVPESTTTPTVESKPPPPNTPPVEPPTAPTTPTDATPSQPLPPAQPINSTPAPETPKPPTFVERKQLRDFGNSDAQIDAMTPQQRADSLDAINAGTPPPREAPKPVEPQAVVNELKPAPTPPPEPVKPATPPAPAPEKKSWTPEAVDEALPSDLTDKGQREWLIDAMKRFTRKEDGRLDLHKMSDEINKGKFPPPPTPGEAPAQPVETPHVEAQAKASEPKKEEPPTPTAEASRGVQGSAEVVQGNSEPASPAARKVGEAGPVPLADLHVDPKRFQYKADTTKETGESDLLKGVKKFDKQKAGTILYWTDAADGRNYVVNGHHRYGLAKRSGETEINAIRINAKDATEARTIGAMANIAEGRGTAIDAAKIFRDSGMDQAALEKEGVSLTEGKAKEGLALSKLNNRLFDAVVHGDIPEGRAVAIAESVDNHAAQDSLYEMLKREEKRGRTVTNAEIREVARFVNSASDVTQKESTLFGDETTVKNLALEKARVSAWIKKQLGRDQKLFSTVSRTANAERLAEAGNVINSESSKKIATDAEMATFLYDKKSTAKGPVSDILNKAAEDLAKGVPFEQATQGVYNAVRSELSRAEADAFRQGKGGTSPETTTGRKEAPGKGEQTGFNFLPEKISKDERAETNEKVRTVLFKLKRDNGMDARVVDPTGEQATAVARLRRFGIKVVMLESKGKFGGFVNNAAPDILFMNSRRTGDLFKEALGHELTHSIAKNAPDLFDALVRAANPAELDFASRKYLENIQAADKATGSFKAEVKRLTSDPNSLREEGLASLVQKLATDPKVWERIIGEGKPEQLSVFQKLAKVIRDFLGMGAKGGDDFASTVMNTLDAFERRNKIEPAGESATSFNVDETKTPSDDEIMAAIKRTKGSTKLARPDLSQRAVTSEARQSFNAIDDLRNKAGQPGHQTDQEVNADAMELMKQPDLKDKLIEHIDGGGLLSAAETAAVRIIADTEQPKNLANGDDAAAARIGRLILADRTQATEMARSFRQRRDPLMSPEQRLQRTIVEALSVPDTAFKPPAKPPAEGAPEAPPVLDEKKAAEEIKKVRERLAGMGYDLSNIKGMSADKAGAMVRQIKAIRASKADALYEYWINSIMSGPGTTIANVTSNMANAAYEFGMVRPVEMALNLVKGSKDAASFKEALPMLRGIGPGIAHGFRNFLRSFREERPVFDQEVAGQANQLDLLSTGGKGSISEAPSVFGMNAAKLGIKGSRIRWATRLAMAADQAQKTMNGYIQVGAEATRAGVKKGLTGDALKTFVSREIGDLNSPSWQASYKIANRMTFNQKPDKFTAAIITARNIVPGGRWVLPFVNTMSNIVKAAYAASPLDTPRLAYKLGRDAVDAARGKDVTYGRGDINQHIAKQILAWGAASAIWNGVGGDDEWITGSKAAFEKKAIREEQYRAAPAQSIKIGGRWYSYGKVEPFATALSAMVDGIHELKNVTHGKDAGDAFGDFLTKAMGQFKDKTFMKGIGDIIQASEGAGKVENWGTNFAVSFIPNAIRQPLTMADPKIRETRKLGEGEEATTFAQRLGRKALPGIIATPSAKVNLWGEDAKKGESDTVSGTDILLRVMGLGGQLTDNQKMDRLILNWNNSHPNDEYHPMTPDSRVKLRNIEHQMDDAEYHLFLEASGRFAARKLEKMNLNADNPQTRDIKVIADSLSAARETVRQRVMVALALKQRGDTAGYNRQITSLQALADRMKP